MITLCKSLYFENYETKTEYGWLVYEPPNKVNYQNRPTYKHKGYLNHMILKELK